MSCLQVSGQLAPEGRWNRTDRYTTFLVKISRHKKRIPLLQLGCIYMTMSP